MIGTVICPTRSGPFDLCVAFVGFREGHDGYDANGNGDCWFCHAADLEKIETRKGWHPIGFDINLAPTSPGVDPLEAGDRVRYIGSRKKRALFPGTVVQAQPGESEFVVLWDNGTRGTNYLRANLHLLGAGDAEFSLAPPTSPGDADLIRCAACDCLEIGAIVRYEEEFHEVVAIDGYEVWLRNGAGASTIADVEDVPVSP